MSLYLIISLVFFSAGLLQGVSGFGAALLAMPLLALVLDVREAVTLTLLNGLIINLFLSLELKRHLEWRKLLPLVVGCLPGIYVGVTLLKTMNPAIMKLCLGVVIIAYALYCLAGRRIRKRVGQGWALVAGFAAGTLGSAFSTGGPPVIIYITLTGWTKEQIKATLSSFFLFITVLALAAHAVNGLTTPHVLLLFAVSALPVLAGVVLGAQFYKRLATKTYLTIIYYLLIALGVMLIISGWGWDGVAG
ncbi:MAG: sulfite exporter TauE/SafE family protein [Desulfurivibrionaceae bacterium]|nr:sulfite exporter TauE/SafE family protein [Desulfurivibrionaceae bacterium]